jgi:oxygen-independent coproporphyrinogen-3 oxidase
MEVKKKIIKKYNQPGPRYTSYPPANYFSTDFSAETFLAGIDQSNHEDPKNISLYFHVPFCPRLCHFCGCNTQLGNNRELIASYMEKMIQEFKNISMYLDKSRKVTQVHWGGGTPNAIKLDYLEEVMNEVYNTFTIADNAEIAIECSPAYLSKDNIARLADIGFNRISLGIQDFNASVLHAINRAPSKLPIETLMDTINNHPFKGVNLDFVYGLPKQTLTSFEKTIRKAAALNPDRIVTFSYAHVPWIKKEQKIIEAIGLPDPEMKLEMFILANDILIEEGYQAIGMDHFAKPRDELSVALKMNQLHRNFQGYCSKETTGQVYAFGTSSISQLNQVYAQNTKNVVNYINRIENEGNAIERGYAVSDKEKIIRHTINEIMCNNYLNLDSIAQENDVSFNELRSILQFDAAKLEPFQNDELLEYKGNEIKVTDLGRLVIRNIAMTFDPKLQVKENTYSKTV